MPRPAWYYQRQLDYAQARETYYRNRQPNTSTTVVPRPTDKLGYKCLFLRVGTIFPIIKLPCSTAATEFLGLTRLNLMQTVTGDDLTRIIPKPIGFKPSMVSAMRSSGTPRAVRAFNNTGRRMIRYTPEAIDNTAQQAYYSAPIADNAQQPTIAGLQTAFNSLATAVRTNLGTYGRISLKLETLSTSN